MNAIVMQFNALADAWLPTFWRACWQGGLAILVVWAVCRGFPRIPARARSWLWRLAYCKLLLALLWATPINVPLLKARPARRVMLAGPMESPADVDQGRAGILVPAPKPGEGGPAPDRQIGSAVPAPQPRQTKGTDASFPSTSPTVSSVPALASAPPPEMASVAAFHVWPTPAAWLLFIWFVGIFAFAFRTGRSLLRARALRRACSPASNRSLHECCAELSRKFRLRAAPALMKSNAISSPLLLGQRRPTIVLPTTVATGSSPQHLRLMIAHELAHLKRRDLAWAWLAFAGECLFFFHPLVWLARREWRVTQEMACDEMVMRATAVPAATYGDMLVGVAALNLSGRMETPMIASGLTETKEALARRLTAMKHIKLNSTKVGALITSVLLAAGAISVVPWRLVAQETADPAVPSTAPGVPGASTTPSDSPMVSRMRAARAQAQAADAENGGGGFGGGFASGGTGGGGGRRGGAGAYGAGGFGGPAVGFGGAPRGASFVAPTSYAPAHFEATVYEIKVPESGIVDLDAMILERAAGTPQNFEDVLKRFGSPRTLYKVDQPVNLYGEDILLGSEEPMITGTSRGYNNNALNSITYQNIGLHTEISATVADGATGPVPDPAKDLNIHMRFQLSVISDSGVPLSDNVNASRIRTINLTQSGTPKFGKPSVLVNVSAAGSDEKSQPVAYIVRYLFTQEK